MKNYKSKASWVYSECAEVIKYHGDPRTVILNAMMETYQDAVNDAITVVMELFKEKTNDETGKHYYVYTHNIQEKVAQLKNVRF